MRILASLVFIALFVGCENKPSKYSASQLDSFGDNENHEYREHVKDSVMKDLNKQIYMDTAGLYISPVKIIKSRFAKKEYSSYKDIELTYKNVSGKKIDGIKFRWYGLNAFGDPADMGTIGNGFGGGFTDDPLSPGRSETSQWSILSRDGKKIVLAWPIEVAFSDGTKWKIGKN
jgi:hypothetical protein